MKGTGNKEINKNKIYNLRLQAWRRTFLFVLFFFFLEILAVTKPDSVLSESHQAPSLIFQILLFQDSKLAGKATVLFALNSVCIGITYSNFESLLTKEKNYCVDSEIRELCGHMILSWQ